MELEWPFITYKMELDLFENEKNDHTRRVLASFREAVSSDPEIALDIAVKNYD